MEFALKQRLIGAAVIIALAVVLIPMILKGTGKQSIHEIPPRPVPTSSLNHNFDMDRTIPIPPEKSKPKPVSDTPPFVTKDKKVSKAVPIKKTKPTSGKDKKKLVKSQSKPSKLVSEKPSDKSVQVSKKQAIVTPSLNAWVVQIASFNAKDKAAALRNKLKKQGYSAFMEGFSAKNKRTMYRVKVGPEPERSKAEKLLKQLQKGTGLKGFVTSHP